MALKHLRSYIEQIEELYLDLQAEVIETQPEFEAGNVDEEVFNNLKAETDNVERDYRMLSYINRLLNIPNRDKKLPKYLKQNKKDLEAFRKDKEDGITASQRIETDKKEVEAFKTGLKEEIQRNKGVV